MNPSEWVRVVCTGAHRQANSGGSHPELVITLARIGLDGLAETRTTRSGTTKGVPGIKRGTTVRAKFGDEWVEMVTHMDQIVAADDFREDHEGRRRWRFPCPRCNPAGWLFGESRLRREVADALSTQSVLDVSLPRRR